MNKKLLLLFLFLAILQSGMAQTQAQLDAFKNESPIFTNRYYRNNVWDVNRSPANANAGMTWRLYSFMSPFDSQTGGSINWGPSMNRYISFELEKSPTGSYLDDVWFSGNTFNITLKLYEADGTYIKDICSFGSFMGFGDKGFLFEQDDFYGTFFANDSYSVGGEVTYTPTTGVLTKLSELKGYKYSPKLEKPTVSTTIFSYNGTAQGVSIPSNAAYTVTGTTSATVVGNYTTTIALNDKVKYAWSDGTTDDVVIAWSIKKGTYNMSNTKWDYTAPFTYNGNINSVILTGLPEGVTVHYYSGNNALNAGTYTASATLMYDGINYNVPIIAPLTWEIKKVSVEKPTIATTSFTFNYSPQKISIRGNGGYFISGTTSATDAGNYTVTMALWDKTNYQWNDGTTDNININWSISRKSVRKPTITTTEFTYRFNISQGPSIPVNGEYTISGASAMNAGSYLATVALKNTNNCQWDDLTTDNIKINWSIAKASFDMSNVKWNYTSPFIYNGTSKSVTLTGLPEGVTVQNYTGNSATNTGIYTASATLTFDAANYNAPTPIVPLNWEISKAMVNIPTVATTAFTYNGNTQGINIPLNEAYSITGTTSATNAGNYTATIALKDWLNYQWNDGTSDNITINWRISQASYDMANAKWDYTEPFYYNGNPKNITLTGLPEGVTVLSYTGNSATNAGNYTAYATLSYDAVNHKEPIIQPMEWTINKAQSEIIANLTNGITPTFNVTANGIASGLTPTGIVTLKNGSQELLSKPLNNGVAQLQVSLPLSGTLAITVSYAGNENYLPADATITIYTISYNLNGGVLNDAIGYFDGSEEILLPIPQKSNFYQFDGWYGDANFAGNPISAIAKGESTSYEIYAKWKRHLNNLSIIKLWDNVLAVSNGDKYEVIRNASFRWYRNGTLLNESEQYISFDGAIPSGVYRVEIIIDGETPIILTHSIEATTAIKAYPNPLRVGNTLIVEMNEERPANEQVSVYNQMGSPVRVVVVREAKGYQISGLPNAGTYLIHITEPGKGATSIKVIVK